MASAWKEETDGVTLMLLLCTWTRLGAHVYEELIFFSGRTVGSVSKQNKLQRWDYCSISNSTKVGLVCGFTIFFLEELFVQDSNLFWWFGVFHFYLYFRSDFFCIFRFRFFLKKKKKGLGHISCIWTGMAWDLWWPNGSILLHLGSVGSPFIENALCTEQANCMAMVKNCPELSLHDLCCTLLDLLPYGPRSSKHAGPEDQYFMLSWYSTLPWFSTETKERCVGRLIPCIASGLRCTFVH